MIDDAGPPEPPADPMSVGQDIWDAYARGMQETQEALAKPKRARPKPAIFDMPAKPTGKMHRHWRSIT